MKNAHEFFRTVLRRINEPEKVKEVRVGSELFIELCNIMNRTTSDKLEFYYSAEKNFPIMMDMSLGLRGYVFVPYEAPSTEAVKQDEEEMGRFIMEMTDVKQPDNLEKIALGHKLYDALTATGSSPTWHFEGFIDVPMERDMSLGAYRYVLIYMDGVRVPKTPAPPVQYPIPMPAPPTKETGTMTVKHLVNLAINGVRFSDVIGELTMPAEHSSEVTRGGSKPAYHIVQPPANRLLLKVDPETDTSMVLFGFVQAVLSMESVKNEHIAVLPVTLRITGQDASKPWVTYEMECRLTDYEVSELSSNRVEEIDFLIAGVVNARIDEDLEPNIHMAINSNEASQIIVALMKAKSTSTKESVIHINSALEHLQILVKESGN